jgi:integrase
MKGSIFFDKRGKKGRYVVLWYDPAIKRTRQILKYKGIPLNDSLALAKKLLAAMQGDYENGIFRIGKFLNNETDVIPYLREWLEAVRPDLSPATYKDYRNSIENHMVPFFRAKTISLHEIEFDTINQLKNSIGRGGKGKFNVINCLHACLKYALKSRRIPAMPAFPEKDKYNIVEPVIKWLPSDRQEAVIDAIPEEHKPIFWWLKYHLRRPSEACALLKEDYADGVFTVQRGFSDKKPHNRTKDKDVHTVPCVADFEKWMEIEKLKGIISPFFFVNPVGKKKGKHYTVDFLADTWREACKKVGEDIQMYSGTKHSTASQMINENGYTIHEVQIAGDWASLESVRKYAKVETATRKALLEKKIVKLQSKRNRKSEGNSQ